MAIKFKFFLFSFFGFLIVGCSSVIITPANMPPTISKTPTLTLIPLQATRTVTPSPTNENQVHPTAPLPNDSAVYQLQTPQDIQLLHILKIGPLDFRPPDASDEDLFMAYLNNQTFLDIAISNDINRYYPKGSDEFSKFNRKTDFEDSPFVPSESTGVILVTDVLKYLNEKNLTLTDGQIINYPSMKLKVFSAGDSRWLILTNFEDNYQLQRLIPVQETSEGSYEIPAKFTTKAIDIYSRDETPELITKYDFNGDGVNDLLSVSWNYLAGSVSGNMIIYAWDEEGLLTIGSASLPGVHPYYGEVNQSSYQIIQNPNEVAQVQITWPRYTWFDCSWTTTYTYSWKNNKEQKTTTGVEMPEKPECYAAKAFKSESPAEKIHWYKKSIANPNPKLNSNDYQAWLKLQLGMAYAMQGQDGEAQKALNDIINGKTKGKFAQLVTEAAANNGTNSPVKTCQFLNEKARELARDNQEFGTEIDGFLAMTPTYPITYAPIPFIVCPFPDVFEALVQNEPDKNVDMSAYTASLGIQARDIQTINLDSDDDNEWLGLIGERSQTITIFDFGSGQWKMDSTWQFDAPAEIQVIPYEVTSETVGKEILAIVSYPPRKEQNCPENTQNFELLVIAKGENGYQVWKFLDISCIQESPIGLSDAKAFLRFMDDNQNTITSNTVFNMDSPNSPSEELEKKLFEIIKRTVKGQSPEAVRKELSSLLASFDDDTPVSKIVRARLLYLVGLSYELENQPEQAVEHYLNLIRAHPDSLWSWLAWARLTPNPITPTP